jgi:RNA binding exosome subunit
MVEIAMENLTPRLARLSTIVHATEDEDKVYQALSNVSPKESFPSKTTVKSSKGHHGNEIRMITMVLAPSSANTYLRFLWSKLVEADRHQILSVLADHVDEQFVFHLRLGKQDSVKGNLRISQEDPIKLEIGFHNFHGSQQDNVEDLRRFLLWLEQN